MSDYTEHLIRMAGGDGEPDLDAIQRREIEDMEDLIDDGIMRTLSGKRIARVLSSRGFGRTDTLLALVRDQAAKLERVRELTGSVVTVHGRLSLRDLILAALDEGK